MGNCETCIQNRKGVFERKMNDSKFCNYFVGKYCEKRKFSPNYIMNLKADSINIARNPFQQANIEHQKKRRLERKSKSRDFLGEHQPR